MLAAAAGELQLLIPVWGAILLVMLGVAYLGLGTMLPRLFAVLSMTVVGCAVGMVAAAWVPLAQPIVVIVGGLVLGGLTAFFQNIAQAVLTAVVLASVLATLAAFIVGPAGFVSYLAVNASGAGYSMQISGPNLARDPILAAALTGLLAGATIGIIRIQFSRSLATVTQGAAVILVGLVELVPATRGGGRGMVATDYPLTLTACWLCLAVIGLVCQRAITKYKQAWDSAVADEAGEEDA
jgi:hypothetical protein